MTEPRQAAVARLAAPLRSRWNALAARERVLVALAGAVVAVALLHAVAVQPAWRTLRMADAEHARLDAQLQRMQQLQTQAQALQSQARAPAGGAATLEALVRRHLGAQSRLQMADDRATVTLNAVAPEALARWLQDARVDARALPLQARLTRNAAGQWDGTLVMSLMQP